jgi:hypothetical protein
MNAMLKELREYRFFLAFMLIIASAIFAGLTAARLAETTYVTSRIEGDTVTIMCNDFVWQTIPDVYAVERETDGGYVIRARSGMLTIPASASPVIRYPISKTED